MTKKNGYIFVLIYDANILIINRRNKRRFLIMKISILELHFRHEKLSVGGFGGQDAFLKAAAAVVEVLYLDVGEDAHGAWREAGIEVGEEGKIVFIQFRHKIGQNITITTRIVNSPGSSIMDDINEMVVFIKF